MSKQFVTIGERIRFIGDTKSRYGNWPEGYWQVYGVEGIVTEYHPAEPETQVMGETFPEIPEYAVVRWDFGGEVCIDPEEEGIRWLRSR